MEESKLDNLKKRYSVLRKKEGLPSFDELSRDFQIERISEVETDYLIREIRKLMADKFSSYLRFLEATLNPVNVPMFVFSITKSIGIKEKEKLTELYKELAKIEVSLIGVDVDFDEKKEAEFVKESFKTWQKTKKEISNFISVVKKGWDNKIEKNNKGYFG
ncbi:MAG: hypothetical protein ABIJ14_03270 [Nanoarchaeota archaeon]|nr:hypothetical protein [Nanoarchaeota archaeon]